MRRFSLLLLLIVCRTLASGQSAFEVIPLGIKGGLDESNLSSYAVSAKGANAWVCLDAGTVYSGITRAIANGIIKGDATSFQKNNIKGYLISHPHLDHVSGMLINATDDTKKEIYATEPCITTLADKYFSWKNWANFTNEGEKPSLGKYTLVHLRPGLEEKLTNISLTVTPYVLSHGNPYESTAFLINNNGSYLLYLGDVGADQIEKSDKMAQLWTAISKLVAAKKLKAIFIECSYANDQPPNMLFGHLTPNLLMSELSVLSMEVGQEKLKDVSIVVTHMKPAGDREANIKKQLLELNALGLKLVFPEQGKLLEF